MSQIRCGAAQATEPLVALSTSVASQACSDICDAEVRSLSNLWALHSRTSRRYTFGPVATLEIAVDVNGNASN